MDIEDFIARWRFTEGSERANKDSFLKDLCRVLGVPEPNGKTGDLDRDTYVFEADSVLYLEGERRSTGKMDLYKQGCFVLEAKQGSAPSSKNVKTARRDTPGWSAAMQLAMGQAFGYARTIDQPPPFVIVSDIGYCFDLYACFDGTGAYHAYPNAQKNRLYVKDIAKHLDLLRAIWIDPTSLDPAKHSERVTQDIAVALAELAVDLESSGYASERVAKFLMRCVFCMFAEDVGLLRDHVFTKSLEAHWLPEPDSFKDGVEELWEAMNAGKRFFTLGKLLHFNGGLFANPEALKLNRKQLGILHRAARHEWADVQPAIFGILIERALNPKERHKLGAHFTPTAYVERLLVPAIEEPLRAEWDSVRVRVRELIPPGQASKPGNVKKAQTIVREFQRRLCETRVLDPACGSGNFLYLALNLFKRLESEVLSTLHDLGVRQLELDDTMLVTPGQFLGLEIRPGTKEIAELVLWIGYLQWHHKMYGQAKNPPEPILRDYRNVECRDALLGPRQSAAAWPRAEFIVGNPPFIGKSRRRAELGDQYLNALAKAYKGMPKGVDYVMYWWHKAAELVAKGEVKRFGFISTNSITQSLNRRVVAGATEEGSGCRLLWATPDHPWVDSQTAAAVRIAMTVGARPEAVTTVRLATVVAEREGGDGESEITLEERVVARLHADLRAGVNVLEAKALRANVGVCSVGFVLFGHGFVLDDASKYAREPAVRPFLSAKDLVQTSRENHVIDFYPLTEAEARKSSPKSFQRVLQLVKPDRDKIRDPSSKKLWWRFGRDKGDLRSALAGMARYIVTPETSKHRIFSFVQSGVRVDNSLIAVALSDAFHLGVLSSRVHEVWSLASGGRLGVGNDPRYNKSKCFDPFPFPNVPQSKTGEIRALAEEIDSHRKRVQSPPELTLTSMYNVLVKLRTRVALTPDEEEVNSKALVATLRKLHDDLDQAVFNAYGWPASISDEGILERLVALNAERTREEARGIVRWLRDDLRKEERRAKKASAAASGAAEQQLELPWPSELPEQVAAIRDLLVANDSAWAANDVAKVYRGATAEAVVPALRTLEALGMAACLTDRVPTWKGLAKAAGQRTMGAVVTQVVSSRPPPSNDLKAATG